MYQKLIFVRLIVIQHEFLRFTGCFISEGKESQKYEVVHPIFPLFSKNTL